MGIARAKGVQQHEQTVAIHILRRKHSPSFFRFGSAQTVATDVID
jgi:hypothetical protein